MDLNFIICGENCRHQCDGYCTLEGMAEITNAVTSSCCYFEDVNMKIKKDVTEV